MENSKQHGEETCAVSNKKGKLMRSKIDHWTYHRLQRSSGTCSRALGIQRDATNSKNKQQKRCTRPLMVLRERRGRCGKQMQVVAQAEAYLFLFMQLGLQFHDGSPVVFQHRHFLIIQLDVVQLYVCT